VGDGVQGFAPGDRIAYAGTLGAYAESRNLPAQRALKLPEGLDLDTAAAGLLRGLTAHMLLGGPHPVAAGATVLVHAAAGGLGQLLTRWAVHQGVTVIGTVSTPAKAEIARAAGAAHVVVGREADFVAEVLAFTNGKGVDVAYDGLGGDFLKRTFDAVAPFGTLASVGQAAGLSPPVAPTELAARSLSLWRPSVMLFISDTQRYQAAAVTLLAALASGELPVDIGATYPLSQAARAHADLAAGATTGSILLKP
jgi:NADPH2:quinone reductase